MLYVKVSSEKLRSELGLSDEELIPWRELKKNLPEDLSSLKGGCEFFSQAQAAKAAAEPRTKFTSTSEYSRLINSKKAGGATEIRQLRSDLAELRRESAWLANCIFSSVGLAVFVYFCASFYFRSFEAKIILAIIVGVALFFVEVILYIIRNK